MRAPQQEREPNRGSPHCDWLGAVRSSCARFGEIGDTERLVGLENGFDKCALVVGCPNSLAGPLAVTTGLRDNRGPRAGCV